MAFPYRDTICWQVTCRGITNQLIVQFQNNVTFALTVGAYVGLYVVYKYKYNRMSHNGKYKHRFIGNIAHLVWNTMAAFQPFPNPHSAQGNLLAGQPIPHLTHC
jgi:hypothetical protein